MEVMYGSPSVSYTHLDVYKRQIHHGVHIVLLNLGHAGPKNFLIYTYGDEMG